MIAIQVIGRDGAEMNISAATGANLMEALRDSGVDEVLALCGGCCSCATCHVYIESGPVGTDTVSGADEDDLLEGSGCRKANSRLSCQVSLGDEHANLVVRIAPGD